MRIAKFVILTIILVLADQITKAFFAHRDFFFGLLHVRGVENFGLSFGLNFGSGINALILIIAVIIFLAFLRGVKFNFGIALLLAGVISNLIDRIAWRYVRDFLDIGLGFTFNLADVFILLGLIWLILSPGANRNDAKSLTVEDEN